jgi:hypothetical protein
MFYMCLYHPWSLINCWMCCAYLISAKRSDRGSGCGSCPPKRDGRWCWSIQGAQALRCCWMTNFAMLQMHHVCLSSDIPVKYARFNFCHYFLGVSKHRAGANVQIISPWFCLFFPGLAEHQDSQNKTLSVYIWLAEMALHVISLMSVGGASLSMKRKQSTEGWLGYTHWACATCGAFLTRRKLSLCCQRSRHPCCCYLTMVKRTLECICDLKRGSVLCGYSRF